MSDDTRSRRQLREELERLNEEHATLQKRYDGINRNLTGLAARVRMMYDWLFNYGRCTEDCHKRANEGRGPCTCGLAHALNPNYTIEWNEKGEPVAVHKNWTIEREEDADGVVETPAAPPIRREEMANDKEVSEQAEGPSGGGPLARRDP